MIMHDPMEFASMDFLSSLLFFGLPSVSQLHADLDLLNSVHCEAPSARR